MALTPVLSVGGYIRIAGAVPATKNQAGYEGLTWTEVKGVDNIGKFGPKANTTKFTTLKDGVEMTLKGSISYGMVPITMADLPDDAGQIAFSSGMDGANRAVVHSAHIVDSHGYEYYVEGYITSFELDQGDANKVKMRSGEFTANTSPLRVAPA